MNRIMYNDDEVMILADACNPSCSGYAGGKASISAGPGDQIQINTPGGGAFGSE